MANGLAWWSNTVVTPSFIHSIKVVYALYLRGGPEHQDDHWMMVDKGTGLPVWIDSTLRSARGDITPEKVGILQDVDKIYIDALRDAGLYDKVWQAGAILLPVKSVGVMGDERTYESCVALRAVTSTDGMTADWVHLPYEFLANVSNDIINKVKGVNRVVYDISSKPPATIEWE